MLIKMLKSIRQEMRRRKIYDNLKNEYEKQPQERVREICNIKEGITLFVTNDRGGGTRNFEEQFLCNYGSVMILRRVGFEKDKDVFYRIESNICGTMLITVAQLPLLFEKNVFDKIIINNLNDFKKCKQILDIVSKYREENDGCELIYLVHDFHSVCLQCNLFTKGQYCNLECEKNNCKLKLGDEEIRIEYWRRIWREFLAKVDEIRCFSESSKDIIMKAYPEINDEVITVIPHDMSYCKFKPIEGSENLPLSIGIIGATYVDFKGKKVVDELIDNYVNDIPITLIGTPWKRVKKFHKNLKCTGIYKQEDLRDIVVKEKISLVIFPTLCPETFSYVVSEVMLMDLPIICFNIGAQAEKVSKYHKGIVCNNIDELKDIISKLS